MTFFNKNFEILNLCDEILKKKLLFTSNVKYLLLTLLFLTFFFLFIKLCVIALIIIMKNLPDDKCILSAVC